MELQANLLPIAKRHFPTFCTQKLKCPRQWQTWMSTFEYQSSVNYSCTIELPRSVPVQDEHDLTPATRLLENRREMQEVETGLARQKDQFSMKMDSLNQRREELVRKEVQLKVSSLHIGIAFQIRQISQRERFKRPSSSQEVN